MDIASATAETEDRLPFPVQPLLDDERGVASREREGSRSRVRHVSARCSGRVKARVVIRPKNCDVLKGLRVVHEPVRTPMNDNAMTR